MFQQNLTTNLLGIANVFVDKIENNSSNIEIHLSAQSKAQVCPCCRQTTKYINDYRTQKIRDIPFQGKETFLYLRKRRYICNSCGKRFFEKYDFLPRYRHFTGRVYTSVITALREKISFKDVGKQFGITTKIINHQNGNIPSVRWEIISRKAERKWLLTMLIRKGGRKRSVCNQSV